MANPTYDQGSIKRRKVPGVALTEKDSSDLSEIIGIHNATAPSLADGDVRQVQLDDKANLKIAFGDNAQLIQLIASYIFPVPMGYKRQLDFGDRTDGQYEYMGINTTDASDTDEDWYLFFGAYDDNGNNTLISSAVGSWTERESAF